ncbi:ChuX/HutX family heme-like substrate-binding protein [Psychrobacter sp. 1U2]|uniref:ChuX/HutX family heme-like substrate-binding protein n=1 Tax=Psychrobacter sp. 1U2 TaxID=3453577 RepID=UPI003F44DA4E
MTHPIQLVQKDIALWQTYQDKKANTPMLFPTEGSAALGVSEFELLLASPHSQYIGGQCREVLEQFESFGPVESIVRNALAVHEKTALYHNLKIGEKMGIALNVGGLDLRFFMWRWQHMLAITDLNSGNPSYSIQFFDEQGAAIDNVFLRELSEDNISRWQAMVDEQAQAVDVTELMIEQAVAPKAWQYKELNDDNRDKLQRRWRKMTDVHQFYHILNKLEIDRASSYIQAPEGAAYQLSTNAVTAVFEQARDSECPIMIFVGNSGLVQIQTGTVKTIKRMGDWINILDKSHNDFTLHLKDQALAQLWCVKRPTADGIVTCIEGFDQYGTSILTVFGQRMEGTSELTAWQKITADIVAEYEQKAAAIA